MAPRNFVKALSLSIVLGILLNIRLNQNQLKSYLEGVQRNLND